MVFIDVRNVDWRGIADAGGLDTDGLRAAYRSLNDNDYDDLYSTLVAIVEQNTDYSATLLRTSSPAVLRLVAESAETMEDVLALLFETGRLQACGINQSIGRRVDRQTTAATGLNMPLDLDERLASCLQVLRI